MKVLYPRCCGIDAHLASVTACALIHDDQTAPEARQREFPTHFSGLQELKNWLLALRITHVVVESTGVYWKPVWDALQGSFTVILANPKQVKNFPGDKTDARDSRWLADLLAHG